MDRQRLADWLRDIARHTEKGSPLIRDVSVYDALSDEGLARKIIAITFSAPECVPPPEEDIRRLNRH